tara:strand:+ start:12644 stop:12964 length:321 start_codon:yes stop_codon:yes gene_type:complete
MKEVKLRSGRKVMIKEMSLDDIDDCKDILRIVFEGGKASTIAGVNKQKTAWLRKGIGGGDFKYWDKKSNIISDNVIKELKDTERDELVDLIQEAQTLGEENPSNSN